MYHCFSQEDTLGILKPVCVKANTQYDQFEHRVLKRAMLRTQMVKNIMPLSGNFKALIPWRALADEPAELQQHIRWRK